MRIVVLSLLAAMFILGPIGCKDDKPAKKKAAVSKKNTAAKTPAPVSNPNSVKSGTKKSPASSGGMCCCKAGTAGGNATMVVETASCSRDLEGKCIAMSSCPK